MAPATQIILSGALTFGVPLALAVRDLVILRRNPPGPGWQPDPAPPQAPPPRGGGDPLLRPLPACLIEAARFRPPAASVRIRELA